MAGLNYEMNVKLEPEDLVPGAWTQATVQLKNVTGEVRYVRVGVPEYGFSTTLQPRDNDTFTARVQVPWEADPAQYIVVVQGVSTKGEYGPRLEVPVTIRSR